MTDERRKTPRVRLDNPAPAKLLTYVPGQVVDVAPNGLLMRVRKPLAAGTVYAVRLVFPDGEVDLRGTVRRCSLAGFETDEQADRVRVYSAALEFDHPVPELAKRLRPGVALQVHVE